MLNVRGVTDTFNVDSDELIRDVSKLYLAEPIKYALVSMLHSQGMMFQKNDEGHNVASGKPVGVEIAMQPKFEQHIDEIEDDEVTINYSAGYADSDLSLVVSDGALVAKYQTIYVPRTGEILRVSSVSSNTLTVTRAEGSTTAAALVHGDQLILQGAAYAENSLSGDPRFPQTAFTYNYTQIVREPYGESRTSAGSAYYNKAQSYAMNKKRAIVSMMRRWNGNLWLGSRGIDSTNKYRTCGGILDFVDSGNVFDVNQNLTEADFNYFCQEYAFKYNSNRKTMFCGSRLLNKVDGWANEKSYIEESNTLEQYGMIVKSLKTRNGIIDLVKEPYFDKFKVGDTPLNGYGVVLELPLIKLKYLSNGVLKARDDIQENDRDGRKGEWLMEAGIAVNVQKAHAILRGV